MPMRILPATAPFIRSPVEGSIHDLVILDAGTDSRLSPSKAA